MKKLFLIPITISLLIACNKDLDTTLTDATASTDAADEMTALAANPSTASLVTEDTLFAKGDTNRPHCKFKHPGLAHGLKITFSELPQAAQDYITANNGGAANIVLILKITKRDSTIEYVVRFNDKQHLHFDALGNKLERPKGDRKFEHIALADLPAAAQTYLADNNIDNTMILGVVKMTKPNGDVEYGVRLKNNVIYAFDASGNYTGTLKGKPRKHK